MAKKFDAIIIGSGFGGVMAAYRLIKSGKTVLMLERGFAVHRGKHNWEPESSLELTEHYDHSWPYEVAKGGQTPQMGVYSAVGGPSNFYGAVSFRFREQDFDPVDQIAKDSGAKWPIDYHALEPYYSQAEQLLQISGEAGIDPTEPFRSVDYPQKPGELSDISKKIKGAARSVGLNPFQLPLAINYHDKSRPICEQCTTCDTFACAIHAKNDLATMMIPQLLRDGMVLKANHLVYKINREKTRVTSVSVYDSINEKNHQFESEIIILSAGALASPQLVLSSGLQEVHSSPDLIGRYLMRHVNGIVFGIFPSVADKEYRFHKQLAILDFYLGHPNHDDLGKKLGSLQQMPTPPGSLIRNAVPGMFGKLISKAVPLITGFLAIAEDQPQYENRIYVDRTKTSKQGLAQAIITHEYSARDHEAFNVLAGEAKKIMRKAGAITNYTHRIKTFSHAVGTMRMGDDPKKSVLDRNCRFNGLDNLYVLDGSFMPSSAALNPSLTISANALRVADYLSKRIL